MRRILFAITTLFLLSACETVRYEYRPPVTDQGRMCITQCAGIKETCRGNEIMRAQSEKRSCEHTQDVKYRSCMSKAKTKDQEKSCDRERSSCWSSESTWRCDEDYRSCFVNCGGTIIVHKEK